MLSHIVERLVQELSAKTAVRRRSRTSSPSTIAMIELLESRQLLSSAPVVTLNPISQQVNGGQTVQFTATASGDPAPSIQWQVSTDGGSTFASIANATSSPYSLTATSAVNGNQYRAVFTNASGTVVSAAATLTVLPIEVTTLIDEDNGTVSANAGNGTSLREAIRFANSQSGPQTIDFAANLAGTITLSAGQLPALTGNVSIIGSKTLQIAINAHAASRVFEVSASGIVSISGLSLMNGNGTANGSTTGLINGGAILNAGRLTIESSAISGSVINGDPMTGSGYGGGIYNTGTLTVSSSTFNGNSSSLGNGGGIANYGTMTIVNSTFSGNSSKSGGAVENLATATISSSTFYGNTLVSGAQVGTGISNYGGTLLLTNTIVDSFNNVMNGILNSTSSNNLFVAGGTGVPTNGVNGNKVVPSIGSLKLAPLASNGGPTKTIALLTGSPAINAGKPTNVIVDQRGLTRDLQPDIGAFELAVVGAPSITVSPQSQSVSVGQTVTFSSAASGSPVPTVQWQVSTNGGSTFTNLAGATSTSYSFTATLTQTNYQYRAVFTNSNGSSTTAIATLTVAPPATGPVVTLNPTDVSINAGLTATFTASASGAPTPAVQWQRSTNGGLSFSNIAGATSSTYSFTVVTGQDGYMYRAVFTNGSGTAVTSAANLFVQAQATLPKITVNPVSQSIPNGNLVIFTAAATGVPSPTVQWQLSTNGGSSYANISGATSTNYQFNTTAAMNGYLYRAVFTNALGSTPTTAATLTVTAPATPPTVTQDPTSLQLVVGSTATFTAAALGTPFPTVQWQVSTDLGTSYKNISGATSRQYSVTATYELSSNLYRAVFSNANGTTNTASASLIVTPPPAAPVLTSNPSAQTVFEGAWVRFTASATGSPTPNYQWQVSTNGGLTYTNLIRTQQQQQNDPPDVLSFNAAYFQNGYLYRAVMSNASGTVISSSARLTVYTTPVLPVVSVQPTDLTVTAGQIATFTATASGGTSTIAKWQVSTDGTTFTDIVGSTTTTYQISDVTTTLAFTAAMAQSGNTYRAVFTNIKGTVTTSNAKLTVNTGPVITQNPVSQSASIGQSVTFTAAATGNPAPTVQWQMSTDGGANYTDIASSTTPTLSVTVAAGMDGNLYRAVFTNAAGVTPTTPAKLTLFTPPVVTVNPVSQTANVGQLVTFTAAAKGTLGPSAQWRVSTNGGATYTNVGPLTPGLSGAGTVTTTYQVTAQASTNGYRYQVLFTNQDGSVQTSDAILNVLTGPVITQSPMSMAAAIGSPVTFSAAATGTPTPTVKWQVSTNSGATFTDIVGATSTSLTFNATSTQNGYQYRAVFNNSAGAATTAAATLTAKALPAVTQDPASISVVSGQQASFTATALGTGAVTVQWQVSTNGGATFANVPGATSTTYSFTADISQNGYRFRAVFTDSVGATVSKVATLTVTSAAPQVNVNPQSQSIVAGRSVTFTASATNPVVQSLARTNAVVGGPAIQWQVSTDGGKTFANVAGANSSTLTLIASSVLNGYQYRAVFTSNSKTTNSTAATLTVLSPPVVKTNPTSQTVTKGTSVTFTAAATSNPTATIQWQVSTNGGATYTTITGATSSALTILASASNNGYLYRAVFTNALGTATTASARLTVR